MCRMHGVVGAIFVLATGCSKSDGGGATATAVPSEAPTISITGTPPPAPLASAAASARAAASAAVAAPSEAPAAKAAVAKATGATATTTAAPVASAKPEAAAPLKPAGTSISGKNFTLAVGSPGCRVDIPCAVTLRITAGGEFHVNKEYPYKFTASAAPGVTFLGSGDANVFSRAAGDFREEGEKTATMTVRFFETLERVITAVTGAVPREDDLGETAALEVAAELELERDAEVESASAPAPVVIRD